MTIDSIEVHIEKLAGIIPDGAAVFLRAPDKTFVIFIGSTEGEALARAIQGEETPRPLTHDLVRSILLGFDIEITRMVISQILEGTYCATLVLAQKSSENHLCKNEVRIDTRPSDAFVLAARIGFPIHVSQEVLDQVKDVSDLITTDNPLPDFPPLGDLGIADDLGTVDRSDLAGPSDGEPD
jgi:bifunctional DNase/RNase